ncbi:MAG: hypothetical protein JJT89_01185 [Nitriliruptoraceae bacterium]|nr:hypothetical protein [Nitriliruptoraceae bacterium]
MSNPTMSGHGESPPIVTAYGLLFCSEVELPELPSLGDSSDAPVVTDVDISRGSVPDHLDEPLQRSRYHEANATEFLLRVPDVGAFFVRGGSRIVVEPLDGVEDADVRVYLLGTCMGVLLNQRGFLVLHTSGIATDDGVALFAGVSGAGKSTLLNELLRRGHRMVVDDVCAVEEGPDGAAWVIPAYPRTRLWADSAARFQMDTSALPRTRASMEKFEIQVPDGFAREPRPLRHLLILDPGPDVEVSVEEVSAFEAFGMVMEHTYRGLLLDGLARRPEHFRLASLVTKSATVSRVRRPTERFELEQLADLVERTVASSSP